MLYEVITGVLAGATSLSSQEATAIAAGSADANGGTGGTGGAGGTGGITIANSGNDYHDVSNSAEIERNNFV